MDERLLQLATQNFYARPEDIRAFFSTAMNEKAYTLSIADKKSIATHTADVTTIKISGLMLREQSIYTDLGMAVSTEEIISEIKTARAAGRKVDLIISSGGGMVSGTSNLSDLIYEHRDSINAYGTSVVASAAMWIFASAGKRYAEPTTVMGSIGVVTSVFDDEKYWSNYGIVWKEIVSENAKNKRPDMKTQDGQDEIKRYLTSLESIFLDNVSKSLAMSKEDIISNFHQGGLITGQDAHAMGILESLLSYDMVATMPSKRQADVKIAKSNLGDVKMDITKEQFDAVQSQLDNATASIKTLEGENATLNVNLVEANAKVANLTAQEIAKAEANKEIVAMAFEHNANKDTVLAMIGCSTKAEAALALLDAKGSVGGTSAYTNDLAEDDVDASKEDADKAELAEAIEIAKRHSVK